MVSPTSNNSQGTPTNTSGSPQSSSSELAGRSVTAGGPPLPVTPAPPETSPSSTSRIWQEVQVPLHEKLAWINRYAGLNLQTEVELNALTSLKLGCSNLTSLPAWIGQLSQLRELKLFNNQLTSLPASIGELSQLQKLDFSSNKLTSLPDSIGQLSQLKELYLGDNQLTSLPDWIGELSQLQKLYLWNNQLTSLPASIGGLSQLQELHLDVNQLTSLPASIGELSQLQKLDLSSNRLTSLPASIGELSQLQQLELRNNQLTSLPASIGGLSQLQKLYLWSNRLTSLPASIGELSQLQKLNLRANQLTSLPASIGKLSQLQYLNLSHNQLTSLPAWIGELSQLQELHLSRNQLTSLPDSLGQLSQLQELHLSRNQLTSLPDSLGQLSQLQDLNLNYNQLTSLPASIGELSQLEELSLRDNQLTSLPASIGGLSQLQELHLSNNQLLSELPLSLGQIPEITYLDTSHTNIPEANRDAILAQCRALRDREGHKTLSQRLKTWATFAKSDLNIDGIEKFNDKQKITINEWLTRLEKTSDFARRQKQLAQTVCAILNSAATHESFQESFFAQVGSNLEACEDRAAMALNEIYTAFKIATLPESASLKDKLGLMTQAAKTLALREALASHIGRYQQTNGNIVYESVEIYLYYETQLKNELNLLTAVDTMSHTNIGKCDWIPIKDLKEKVEASYFDHLMELPIFSNILKTLPEIEKINEEYADKLEELDGKGLSEDEYMKACDLNMNEQKQAVKMAARQWYEKEMNRS